VKSFCEQSHSFVLRCWLEPREIEGADPEWRGEAEHVATGKRVYFRSLEELKQILAAYLPGMIEGEKREDIEHAYQWREA